MTRHFLREGCRALIGVLLFAQLAVAAYACPALLPAARMKALTESTAVTAEIAVIDGNPAGAALPVQQAMDCSDMAGPMDAQFANLCAEHCHHGQQSDQAATLNVPAALLTALYATPSAAEPSARLAAAEPSALAAASPPLAVLHCCFRI